MRLFWYAIIRHPEEKNEKPRLLTESPMFVLAKDENHARILAARHENVEDGDLEHIEILVRPF